MKYGIWFLCSALALVFAVGLFAGCGGDDDTGTTGGGSADPRDKEGMPLVRAKLKNALPAGTPPRSARVVGSSSGSPSQTHEVGPVAPGEEKASQPEGTESADEVEVTVEGGEEPVTGSGSYPGEMIKAVHIEIGPNGATATVKFHSQRPQETIPLSGQ